MNKRILYFLPILFLAGSLYAEARKTGQRRPGQFVSESVYISSNSFSVGIGTFAAVISSYPASLHAITVNKAGSSDSQIDVWDTRVSTFAEGARKIASLAGASSRTLFYNIDCSSGIAVNITGTAAPDVTYIYGER